MHDEGPTAGSALVAASSLDQLAAALREFAAARDWERLHLPKNLLLALVGEVGELSALFAWASQADAADLDDPQRRSDVEDELADVLIYLVRLADVLNVDLVRVANAKIERNKGRFPPSGPAH